VDGIFYIVGGRTNGPMDGLQNRVDAYDPGDAPVDAEGEHAGRARRLHGRRGQTARS
jgi:hypothetical protein